MYCKSLVGLQYHGALWETFTNEALQMQSQNDKQTHTHKSKQMLQIA